MFGFALRPAFIFGTDTLAFDDSPLTIGTPVHEKTKLHILPLFEIFNH